MRPAGDLDAFRRRPDGTHVASEHFVYLCEHQRLYALFLWGRPPPDETRRLIEALAVEMRPEAVPHRTLVDFSGLTGIDAESFSLLRDFLSSIEARQAEVTEREAIIRPGGLAGTIVAGFFVLFPQRYPTRLFTEAAPALDFLELDRATWDRWQALLADVRRVAPELVRLRQVLERRLDRVDLAAAARELGMSARTLQRKLKDQGTTFQAELDQARLEAADQLVAGTDEKLTAVAARVGFSSYPHFSQWYRRLAGVTAEARRQASRPTGG